ncbi:MAG: hypothetical protein FWG11_01140, partial [Promicromonosporaceae bacterium]|nr:hypothetical protein [Promicromonosporaceae bacterium]
MSEPTKAGEETLSAVPPTSGPVNCTGSSSCAPGSAAPAALGSAAFVAAGVPTPEFEIVAAGETPKMAAPYVIKAPSEGSSVGVFIVRTPEEAPAAIEAAGKFAPRLLVEEFVQG